jgi:hypothetical protein
LRVLECLGVWPADANANFRRLPPGAAHQSLWLLLFLHHRHDSLSPIGDDGVELLQRTRRRKWPRPISRGNHRPVGRLRGWYVRRGRRMLFVGHAHG